MWYSNRTWTLLMLSLVPTKVNGTIPCKTKYIKIKNNTHYMLENINKLNRTALCWQQARHRYTQLTSCRGCLLSLSPSILTRTTPDLSTISWMTFPFLPITLPGEITRRNETVTTGYKNIYRWYKMKRINEMQQNERFEYFWFNQLLRSAKTVDLPTRFLGTCTESSKNSKKPLAFFTASAVWNNNHLNVLILTISSMKNTNTGTINLKIKEGKVPPCTSFLILNNGHF